MDVLLSSLLVPNIMELKITYHIPTVTFDSKSPPISYYFTSAVSDL